VEDVESWRNEDKVEEEEGWERGMLMAMACSISGIESARVVAILE
jgi:hypothetical protein